MRMGPITVQAAALAVLAGGLALLGRAGAQQPAAPHPLDPLSAVEITRAVEILRGSGRVGPEARFPTLALHEPAKTDVLRHQPGALLPRRAFAVVYDRAANRTSEAVVDLTARSLTSWRDIPGAQPSIMVEDFLLAQRLVRADLRWQAAIRRRGITDLGRVQIDTWSAGYYGEEDGGARRLRAVAYYNGLAQNPYARPIEGVVALVDLTAGRVTEVVDTGVVPVPRGTAEYDSPVRGASSLRPLRITQPQGASFEVRGHEVRWDRWRFRFGMHPREGLVLHQVRWDDGGRERPVLYRASLSEMLVPYADNSPGWFFRNVFDAGELGLGWTAFSLEPGTDCPENALLLPAVVADEHGQPVERPRVIGLYERDGGLLWKHYDPPTMRNASRRGRQLVLTFVATAGNYDYGFQWIFHQDGTLEMEAQLTGILMTRAVADAAAAHGAESLGHLVMPNVEAVHHQHFFNFRLDLDVDGAAGNSVVELNTGPAGEGAGNAHGTAFVTREALLQTEREARRSMDLASSRRWKVINRGARNALGQPSGYILLPGENAVPYARPDSWLRKRAGFLDAHLWVTPFAPAERYAAGDYPNQSRGGDGLPRWTSANRSVENEDVVLWYTMGVTHIPRPEEWPVMPVHPAGFKLVPAGFFHRNPTLP